MGGGANRVLGGQVVALHCKVTYYPLIATTKEVLSFTVVPLALERLDEEGATVRAMNEEEDKSRTAPSGQPPPQEHKKCLFVTKRDHDMTQEESESVRS